MDKINGIAVGDKFTMDGRLFQCEDIHGNIMIYSEIKTSFLKRIGNFIKHLINSKHKSIL